VPWRKQLICLCGHLTLVSGNSRNVLMLHRCWCPRLILSFGMYKPTYASIMQDSNVPQFSSSASAQQGQQSFRSQNGGRQPLTAARLSAIFASAFIPMQGPNKFRVVGRGNPFTRPDGTQVRIWNVAAFASIADKDKAKEAFLRGYQLEQANQIEAAQQPYKDALNMLMSFNVTEQNAADYQGVYEISGLVELGNVTDRTQGSATFGQVTGQRLVINNPRPVAVTRQGQDVGSDFAIPKATPATPQTPEVTNAGGFQVRQDAQTAPIMTEEESQALNECPDGNTGAGE
jgi:hypothetical protein